MGRLVQFVLTLVLTIIISFVIVSLLFSPVTEVHIYTILIMSVFLAVRGLEKGR
jgi:hypothetical protein